MRYIELLFRDGARLECTSRRDGERARGIWGDVSAGDEGVIIRGWARS